VNLDASVDTDFAYVGGTLAFSGSLTFGNLTPMAGYFVRIFWTATSQPFSWNVSLITDSSGSFQHTFDIPWDHPVGNSSFYVEFVRASDAFADNNTGVQSVEIWNLVDLILDDQIITVTTRGDSFDVTGYVINAGSAYSSDVSILLLIDGNESGLADVTDENGRFSINLDVPSNADPGFYILTPNISTEYYELNQSDSWNITIKLESYITIRREYPLDRNGLWVDLMPGEGFSFSIRLRDDNGIYLNDTSVDVYLNETLMQTSYLSIPNYNLIQVIIPSSWTTSGYYYLNITYSGSTFVLPTWGPQENYDDLHIFTEVNVNIVGDTVVAQLAPIQISGILIDDQDNPISNREVSMVYNGTEYHNVTTEESGLFSYRNIEPTNITGDYEYKIIFYSRTGNQELGPYTLTIRAQEGAPIDTMVLVLWIGVIAVEMVAALILITRKRFSYTRSNQFSSQIKRGAKNNQQIMIRWL
jgi:hypothetical protein